MLPREVLKQVRKLQLRAKKAVENLLGGEYHSIFKGAGIAFEEVRPYQVGDDVRSIDWNVTARMDHPFIKRYIEERERTVILALDASASMRFGTGRMTKREVAAELAAVLAFSAVSNNDRVGLMLFSDKIEHYLPPRKGATHVLRVVRDALFFEAKSRGTSLADGLDHLNRVVRRRSIVFLFSDFQGPDYERPLGRAARRHELIAVWLQDPRERELPNVGLADVEDAETGRRLLVDTGSAALRAAYAKQAAARGEAVRRRLAAAGVDAIEAATDGRHLDALVRFFRLRQRQAMRER